MLHQLTSLPKNPIRASSARPSFDSQTSWPLALTADFLLT
jgi:hypothetical protein